MVLSSCQFCQRRLGSEMGVSFGDTCDIWTCSNSSFQTFGETFQSGEHMRSRFFNLLQLEETGC